MKWGFRVMFLEIVNLSGFREGAVIFLGPIQVTEVLLENSSWLLILPALGSRKKKVQLLLKVPNHNMMWC